MNIPNETPENVISARDFVAWYNGLPGAENLNPKLDGASVSIIGQGNVAMDVARILLTPLDELRKTDITEHAAQMLFESRVKEVNLIGRRGPLQAAFTIKELREMLKIPNCTTIWRPSDFDRVSVEDLPRPRKRITELMLKSVAEKPNASADKVFRPIFFRSPKSISDDGRELELSVTQVIENKAVDTDQIEIIQTNTILRSIGYKSEKVDPNLNFDERNGFVSNANGRVIRNNLTGSDHTIDDIEDKFEPGLYTAGWLATGPTGVIITTMNNAFAIADTICKDFDSELIKVKESKSGINIDDFKRVVTWDQWKKIDEAEMEEGRKYNKPREKILDIEKMLIVSGFK